MFVSLFSDFFSSCSCRTSDAAVSNHPRPERTVCLFASGNVDGYVVLTRFFRFLFIFILIRSRNCPAGVHYLSLSLSLTLYRLIQNWFKYFPIIRRWIHWTCNSLMEFFISANGMSRSGSQNVECSYVVLAISSTNFPFCFAVIS